MILKNIDCLVGMKELADDSLDLIVADPPYNLGKDYGNDSDKQKNEQFLEWTYGWIKLAISKLKPDGSFYIFTSWRFSPEIFSFIKSTGLIMLNEIIWDRKVPSMGGSTRRYSSVHDTIGFFAKSKKHYFDLDAIRIPYDAETKKARTRTIFIGKKWLEMGYNPKDLWSVARLHRIHSQRQNHPTQKPLEIIERMVLASCPENGTVLDPFGGTGTTAEACIRNNRNYVLYELNSQYFEIIQNRINDLVNVKAEIDNNQLPKKEKQLPLLSPSSLSKHLEPPPVNLSTNYT